MNINVVELRNYLLKPNMREHFIDNFEAHFIFTQKAVNMHVLGQFRLIGEPDHFVWLRGFSDMQGHRDSLQNFYGGPTWKKYRQFTNDMIVDSDHVHLLRPLSNIADLTCGLDADILADEFDAGVLSTHTGIIAIDIYQAQPGRRDELVDKFQANVAPIYANEGIHIRGLFVAEMSENMYKRLPVIQNADDFVVVTAYETEEACREKRDKVSSHVNDALTPSLNTISESLLLEPTLRSPLRYMEQ